MIPQFTQDSIIVYTDIRMTTKQRLLPLKGLLNTRELGGYPVTVGQKQKQVKWGLIYRSGGPEYITPADRAMLEERKIKTVVDFRSRNERTAVFDLSSLVQKLEIPIDAGNLMGTILDTGEWLYNSTPQGAEREMLKLYSILPEEGIPRYRKLFVLLSEADNAPLLYHCSAGKDRTGLASALILHALGADRTTIMEDYLASTEHLRPYWETYCRDQSYMLPYMIVKEEYLLAAFSAIEKYGGIDRYLKKELEADVNLLREQYTEPML